MAGSDSDLFPQRIEMGEKFNHRGEKLMERRPEETERRLEVTKSRRGGLRSFFVRRNELSLSPDLYLHRWTCFNLSVG